MHDCQDQKGIVFKYASDFLDDGLHVVNVLQRHKRYRAVCATFGEGKLGCVRANGGRRLRVGHGGSAHGEGQVDAEHPVAKVLQIAADTAFAAANIDRQSASRGDEGQEALSVEAPVAVLAAWGSDPLDPLVRVRVPAVAQTLYLIGHHGLSGVLMGSSQARALEQAMDAH
jgi:hypothetical protein